MKFTANTKVFLDAVKATVDIFKRSALVPVNGLDILVTAPEKGMLSLEAANQGLYVKHMFAGDVDEPGDVVIDGIAFRSYKLTGKTVDFSYNGSTISLKSSKFSAKVDAAGESTKITTQRPEAMKTQVTVSSETLHTGLKAVSFSPHDADGQINAHVYTRDGKLFVTANDSYRAAMYSKSLADGGEVDAVLPTGFLLAATACLTGDVRLGADTAFRLTTDVVDVYHPMMQAESADIESFILGLVEGGEENATIEFEIAPAKEAISAAASIMARDQNDGTIIIKFDGASAGCTVKTSKGSATSEFDAQTKDPTKIALGARHVAEFFNMLHKGKITMKTWDDHVLIDGGDGTYYVQPQIEL